MRAIADAAAPILVMRDMGTPYRGHGARRIGTSASVDRALARSYLSRVSQSTAGNRLRRILAARAAKHLSARDFAWRATLRPASALPIRKDMHA
jgi:hypothetical protein